MFLITDTSLQNNKYKIIRVLGQGGFGITYLAEHTMLDKLVAIKEFFPKEYCERDESTSHVTIGLKNSSELVESLKSKFLKEAKNISKLDHPGIVKIFDIFQENGTAYYIMEYVEGEALSTKIKREGAIPEEKAISLLRKMASAISHIHSLSMNHLDIKPANIMIRFKDGEPVLIDFGLSKQYDSAGGQTSTTPVGISHGYAPIEQYIPGGVSSFSPQTDIYALGATLFTMLTGLTPPHYGEILENGIPEYPYSVSEISKVAIEHALETKKQKRPQSIEEFMTHFDTIVENVSKSQIERNPGSINDNQSEVQIATPLNISEVKLQESILTDSKNDSGDSKGDFMTIDPTIENEDSFDESIDYNTDEDNTQVIESNQSLQRLTDENYINLGLSVQWSSEFIGVATPSKDGNHKYSFFLDNGIELSKEEFTTLGYRLPTIKDVEELMAKCEYSFSKKERVFRFTGKNGNSIKLPFSAIDEVLLKESSEPDMGGYCYLFHLSNGDYHLHKSKPCAAHIWTIKE